MVADVIYEMALSIAFTSPPTKAAWRGGASGPRAPPRRSHSSFTVDFETLSTSNLLHKVRPYPHTALHSVRVSTQDWTSVIVCGRRNRNMLLAACACGGVLVEICVRPCPCPLSSPLIQVSLSVSRFILLIPLLVYFPLSALRTRLGGNASLSLR